MLDSIDMDELIEWMAYERIEPFGEERADVRSAINTATLVNVNRGRGQRAVSPSDVMPRFDAAYLPKKSSTEFVAELAAKLGAKNAG